MTEPDILHRLATTIEARKSVSPTTSYVAKLLHEGQDKILRKVTEEAVEILLASKDGDRQNIARETADLWFHCLVLLAHHGLGPDDVLEELRRREGTSGIDEKALRKIG